MSAIVVRVAGVVVVINGMPDFGVDFNVDGQVTRKQARHRTIRFRGGSTQLQDPYHSIRVHNLSEDPCDALMALHGTKHAEAEINGQVVYDVTLFVQKRPRAFIIQWKA